MKEKERQLIYELRMKGVGYKAIAAVLGKSRDTVRLFCKNNGLDGDSKVVALNVKEQMKNHLLCSFCGKPIKQNKRGRTRKYCSEECRREWWNKHPQARNKKGEANYRYICPYCEKEFTCYGNKKRKFCSHDCYIKSRFWSEEDEV